MLRLSIFYYFIWKMLWYIIRVICFNSSLHLVHVCNEWCPRSCTIYLRGQYAESHSESILYSRLCSLDITFLLCYCGLEISLNTSLLIKYSFYSIIFFLLVKFRFVYVLQIKKGKHTRQFPPPFLIGLMS